MTLERSRPNATQYHPSGDGFADEQSVTLISVRSLIIFALAILVGLVTGLAAAIPAGITATQAAEPSVGVAVGVLAGIATAMLTGLGAAGALNALVGRKS